MRGLVSNILTLIALLFASYIVTSEFETFLKYISNTQILPLILATSIYFLLSWRTANFFSIFFENKKNHRNIFLVSQISKYIPGKIWQIGHQYSLSKGKAKAVDILRANIYLTLVQIALCLLLFSPLLISQISKINIAFSILITGTCMVLFLGFLHSINSKLKFNNYFKIILNPPKNIALYALKYSLEFLVLYLAAYTLISYSIFATNFGLSLKLAIYSAGSWAIGTLSVIFPAGLGIREGTLLITSSISEMPFSTTEILAYAIFTRIWQIILDIITGLTGIFLIWQEKKSAM